MTKDATKPNNSAHLDGIINQVNIAGEKDGSVTAWIIVGTQDRLVKKDTKEVSFINPHHHRVKISGATGETAEILRTLSEKNFREERVSVSVDGSLKTSGDGITYILASPEKFLLTDEIDYKNNRKATIRGEVTETTINQGYAMMKVDLDGEASVRIKISKEKQPRVWSDIASGKIHKGTAMSAEGRIRTQPLNNGSESMKSLFIDATKCEQITLTKRQTNKTQQSL